MRKFVTVFALSMATCFAFAYDIKVDGLCYNINADGTTLTVTYEQEMYPRYISLNGDVIIPDKVSYNGIDYKVTAIGDLAFYQVQTIKSVSIPNSVKTIERRAFYFCERLESISIPNSVTFIGDLALCGCTHLTSVTLPNSLTALNNTVLAGCTSLTSVTIPNTVRTIGSSAFSLCTSLKSINIPKHVTFIGSEAFRDCTSLARIDAYPDPQKVELGSNLFYTSTGYTSSVPTCVIHTLPEYCDAYKNAAQWRDFSHFVGDLVNTVTVGDINDDGSIDGSDVSILLEMVLSGGLTAEQLAVADLNGDGSVDGSDVSILLEMVLSGE